MRWICLLIMSVAVKAPAIAQIRQRNERTTIV